MQELRAPPLLITLCIRKVATDLWQYASDLGLLPVDLSEMLWQELVKKGGGKAQLYELQVFAEYVWRPTSLRLKGMPQINAGGLQYLGYAQGLVTLNLSSCSWLDSLLFIPTLPHLKCLNLRDCWRLAGDSLAFIQHLPRLECLDLGNIHSLNDEFASHYITGIQSLIALNVSGTGIGDSFVESLTYGCRLQQWVTSKQKVISVDRAASNALEAWPVSNIVHLKMQQTNISNASISHLFSLKSLLLLDLRQTSVKFNAIAPLQGRHNLISLSSNCRHLLARTNMLLAATLHGACGCESMAYSSQGKMPTDEIETWAQRGFACLLQGASAMSKFFQHQNLTKTCNTYWQ